jgi:hypothetical protein
VLAREEKKKKFAPPSAGKARRYWHSAETAQSAYAHHFT